VESPALIYLHLPKCGGTTLNRLIEWEYPSLRTFSIDPSFFRWSWYRLLQWPERRLARLRVIKGHMPFGIHTRLPQPAKYITVLREPVERVISEYYFARHYRLHPQHKRLQSLSLEQYAATTPHHNLQTKLLAGRPGPRDFLAGDCTDETLAAAKFNLASHFTVAGLTERFDETLALFKVLLGWKLSHYTSFNITRARPDKDAVPPSTQRLIAEHNRYDVELYNHVVPLFDQALAANRDALTKANAEVAHARTLTNLGQTLYQSASTFRKSFIRLHSAL
jgi:hypothetical protein